MKSQTSATVSWVNDHPSVGKSAGTRSIRDSREIKAVATAGLAYAEFMNSKDGTHSRNVQDLRQNGGESVSGISGTIVSGESHEISGPGPGSDSSIAKLLTISPMNPRDIARHFKAHPPATMVALRKSVEDATAYQTAFAEWVGNVSDLTDQVSAVERVGSSSSNEIVLKPRQLQIAVVTGASLIEDRAGAKSVVAGSRGLSVPIGRIGGRTVRYRVGKTRGHSLQAPPVATALDSGMLVVTSQRDVFVGLKQSRECLFSKLLSHQNTGDGATVFSVSNREKATVVRYGQEIAGWFEFNLAVALAIYRREIDEFLEALRAELKQVENEQPPVPASIQ